MEYYSPYVFGVGGVAHSTLAFFYVMTKSNWKLLYLLGHMCILTTMFIRLDSRFIHSLTSTILGSVGHGLLLIYSILYPTPDMLMNTVFTAGQVGMIVNYSRDYTYKNTNKTLNIISLVAFVLLCGFYLIKTVTIFGERNVGLALGNLLVAIVYILFITSETMVLEGKGGV